MYQGLQLEQYLALTKSSINDLKERLRPDAVARIKSSLVLETVAAKENITVSDEEADEELQKMAESYQMKVEELKDMMGDREKESLKKDLASRKALDFLTENAKEV
jgi:trigger factor